jgi:hypothetical protein
MAGSSLKDSELAEILNRSSDDSDSASSVSSDDSSDNEIDDTALADAIINNDSDEEEEESHKTFHWEKMDNYVGQRQVFSVTSGPQNEAQNVDEILTSFELFFDPQIIQLIVTETNRYAEQYKNQRGNLFTFRSPVRAWVPVTENEIYTVLGMFLLMGIVQKPTLRSYFSIKRVISTPGFADIMSRDRFELICKFLHFIDNDSLQTYEGPPKLFKIYPILCHLNSKFQSLYLPKQNISIDESLTLWKGRLSFLQYLPLKASKFGIKTFELCESSTGYLWSFLVYTGKDTTLESQLISPQTLKTSAIVLKLLEPLVGKGFTLWMDNFYNSPDLALELKLKHATDCVGTLRINRKNVPKEIKEKKLKKGEIIARHSGPVTILKWCDKKNITMISTYHNADTKSITKRGKEIIKPTCVHDYNYSMGGVDLKDQLLNMYLVERKRMNKWYMKLFKRLLNSTVLNSMIIFRQATGRNIDHLSFRVQLVEGLFSKYAEERSRVGRRASDNTLPRLRERHFIRRVAPKSQKSRPQRRCVVCTKHGKKKLSVYCCEECNVGLCLENCFEAYHTKLDF